MLLSILFFRSRQVQGPARGKGGALGTVWKSAEPVPGLFFNGFNRVVVPVGMVVGQAHMPYAGLQAESGGLTGRGMAPAAGAIKLCVEEVGVVDEQIGAATGRVQGEALFRSHGGEFIIWDHNDPTALSRGAAQTGRLPGMGQGDGCDRQAGQPVLWAWSGADLETGCNVGPSYWRKWRMQKGV